MTFVSLVSKNLSRNKRRTTLTVISVAVLLFLFTLLLTVLTTMRSILASADTQAVLAVHRKTAITDTMPESYRKKIEEIPGVIAVCPFEWYGGLGSDIRYLFPSLAVDPYTFPTVMPEFKMHREVYQQFLMNRKAAVTGLKTAQKLRLKPGDRTILHGTIYPVDLEFEIVGLFTEAPNPAIFILHRDYLEEALGRPGKANIFWVKVENTQQMEQVALAIDQKFVNSPAETLTESKGSFFMGFVSMMGNIQMIVSLLASIVLVTLFLITANSTAMSIRERTLEVAVLKTLGFQRWKVTALLVAESCTMTIAGGLMGTLAAYGVFSLHGIDIGVGFLRNVVVYPDTVGKGILISVLMGLASAIIPAMRVSTLPIHQGLRRVG